MQLKVLTLTQPWATLVAIGAKQLETRSWATSYRGPLAIHAAKGLADMTEAEYRALLRREPFASVLYDPHDPYTPLHARLPRGAVVAVCRLSACWRVPVVPWHTYGGQITLPPAEPERSFGDYTPGRFAWELADVRRLPTPIPARGALGLWDFTLCDVCEVRAALPDFCLCQPCLDESETASKNAGRLTDAPLAYVVSGRLL